MPRGRHHRDPHPGRIDDLAVAELSAKTTKNPLPTARTVAPVAVDDLVDAVGVITVPMADQHQRHSAQSSQAVDVGGVVRTGSTTTSSSLPGARSAQVLVPSRVMMPGLSHSNTDAIKTTQESMTGRIAPVGGMSPPLRR